MYMTRQPIQAMMQPMFLFDEPSPPKAPGAVPAPSAAPATATTRASKAAPIQTSPETCLKTYFGYDQFRPLQKEIITEALEGRSVIGILPTGSGKSICYQLPSLMLPGLTLVISPLISLMKDQVDGLMERSIPALSLTSHDTAAEYREKLEALRKGSVRLCFVAPERLGNDAFLGALAGRPVSLLAVDEAHCVSQWGHDFRPEYRQIPEFRKRIGNPPLMALTATAQPRVQADLSKGLGIPDARLYKASIDRPNLWIGMEHCETQAQRRSAITRLVSDLGPGSAVIYATSRKDTEELAEHLHQRLHSTLQGSVACYHAGLSAEARTAVQNRFMNGFVKVVVATNAFGMGIDKSDIRLVIHAGVPDSLEAYFQEIGRAGRDGKPARCLMILLPGSDVKRREYLLQDNPDKLAHERFRLMKSWVWLQDRCRRQFLLEYFGEKGKSLSQDCCSHCHPLDETSRQTWISDAVTQEKSRRKDKKKGFAEAGESRSSGSRGITPAAVLSEHWAELLFEDLRSWRTEKAQAAQVPPYVIFGDRDLKGIALAAPRSLDELAACRGVGPQKLAIHGQIILQMVGAFLERCPGALSTAASPSPSMPAREAAPVLTSPGQAKGLSPADTASHTSEDSEYWPDSDWDDQDGSDQYPDEAAPFTSPSARNAPAPKPPKTALAPLPQKTKESRATLVERCARLANQGTSIEELTLKLDRSPATLMQYLADWVANAPDDTWKPIPLKHVGRDEYQTISAVLVRLDYKDSILKPVHEALGGKFTWDQIRIALAVWLYRDPRGPKLKPPGLGE